ncbi:G-protein signaling regulator [Basidiobolus meristosporus CBS 931.73]|uniref:G-protein signaling regulator n=1 Tax=Basidiobolus meristosporus CBS 931.73 TaxID=1314790 RepID=A0A1Y1YCJ1_9FUNG|nr:G-protein signaling regulator [Basidiobolus meristosporus CBS 931.73]|eukprot:ORX95750.1 G-protein signaling regulator [Basidiobolus meristosporus CBS 931.73]
MDEKLIINDPQLPTLDQVLSRKTTPPVCLYNYYLFLRDTHRSVENLDFWLDVVAHENLCKLYCKELLHNLNETQSHGSSLSPPETYGTSNSCKLSLQEVSNELRYSAISGTSTERRSSSNAKSEDLPDQASSSIGTNPNAPYAKPRAASSLPLHQTQTKVKREDLRQSAEKIYYKYIVSGAEKELILPEMIKYRISHMIEVDQRDDPEVFLEAKLFVFDYMAQDSFPRFIRARAYSNLVALHAMFRLVLGLFILFIGFTVEFTLIFLDYQPRLTRLWGFIPIWVGTLNIYVHQKRFSPLLTILGISEKSLLHFNRIKDSHIRHLHVVQAIRIVCLTLVISTAVVGIFYAIPGCRL